MQYSRLFGSNFPDQLITVGTRKDVDNTVASLVNQITVLMESGDINTASQLYERNKNILEPYCDSAAYQNRLQEEIYNTGILAISKADVVTSQTEPKQETGNYWLVEY